MVHTSIQGAPRPRLEPFVFLFLLLAFVPSAVGIARVVSLASGTALLPDDPRITAHPVPIAIHALGSTIFALLGAFQLSTSARRRWPGLHRRLGWGLVVLVAATALSGVWLTLALPLAPDDTRMLSAARIVVGTAVVFFLMQAVRAALARDFARHRRFMIRAYALAMGAGTQVLTVLPFAIAGALHTPTMRSALMIAGWAINFGVAEYVVRRGVARAKTSMRALVLDRYGGPDALSLRDVERPEPGPRDVIVKVHAASINAMDLRIMRANPFLVRLQNGLFRPKRAILGADFAGTVHAIGAEVRAFAVGDEVFGESTFEGGLGAFAEYVRVAEHALVKRDPSLSVEEAAALPLAGITALQALDRAALPRAAKVLVQGAGGGVGTALVQIAKSRGAEVTCVCGPGNVELMQALGADRVVDYSREELEPGSRFDAIFGVNGYRSLSDYRALLAPNGVYVMVGGENRQLFEALVCGRFALGRRAKVLTLDDSTLRADLERLSSLVESGALRPIVGDVFGFERAREAFVRAEGSHVRGKLVLRFPA